LGGNYGLIDKDTLQPNPDFYNYHLFNSLMGPKVGGGGGGRGGRGGGGGGGGVG